MRLLGMLTGGGIAAFFFFTWIIETLWNSIVVGHLGFPVKLNYWQTAGLYFLVILFTAWTGIGAAGRIWHRRHPRD